MTDSGITFVAASAVASKYGYFPSEGLNLAAMICFAVVGVAQMFLYWRYRQKVFSLYFLIGIGCKYHLGPL